MVALSHKRHKKHKRHKRVLKMILDPIIQNRYVLFVPFVPFVAHSQRRASMGFSRAAFHAGQRPKMMPTAAEMPTPTAMAHKGT